MSDEENKLVARGLPFEATRDGVLNFFGIEDSQLTLPTWSDSGRCKGFAFIACNSAEEVERIRRFDEKEFEAQGNCRTVSITDYEERPPRERRRGGQRNQGGDQRDGNRGDNRRNFSSDQTSREIYVSNANFDATVEDFMDHFGQYGEIEEVTMPSNYATGKNRGFAFVRFADSSSVDPATSEDGKLMMGREIGVRENSGSRGGQRQRGNRTREPKTYQSDDETSREIYVSNVSYDATEEDFQNTFGQYGVVEDVTIPIQYSNGRPKGFAFVRFATRAGVENALTDADGTHMLGREIGVRENRGRAGRRN